LKAAKSFQRTGKEGGEVQVEGKEKAEKASKGLRRKPWKKKVQNDSGEQKIARGQAERQNKEGNLPGTSKEKRKRRGVGPRYNKKTKFFEGK